MLHPDALLHYPDALVSLYAKVEADILASMAARIAAYGDFIPSAEYQFRKLQDMGNLHDEILKKLSRMTGKTKHELRRLMKKAGAETLKADDAIYKKAGLDPRPIAQSPALQSIIETGLERTAGLFENLTRTTANTATRQFEQALDRAWLQVQSGAFDYNTAVRMAVKDLAGKGAAVIEYPSGHIDRMDVAVRRAVVTGINRTALELQEARAEEMGCDLVETTAHAGARIGDGGENPGNHAAWQGKIYSRSGAHPKYPPLVEATGYGTGEGLGGWNCRHSFFPFFEGISEPTYTQAELDEMNAPKYEYNGQKLTEAEAVGRQRQIERNLRRWKREYKAMEAAGQPTDEAAAKISRWQATQKDFLEQTGLKRQYGRESVEGFGRSEAARASSAARMELDKYRGIRYNKDGTIRVTDDWTQKKRASIPKKYKPNAVVDTISRGGKQRDRAIYGSDGILKMQIHGGGHGNLKKHPYGARGEHIHDYTWPLDGNKPDKPARDATLEERMQHKDILGGEDNDG